MSDILEAALSYASQGWAVFPCVPGGKTPLTKHGLHDATTDEAKIRRWWAQWPTANVAVNCGASNLAVVDLDVKEHDGPANWTAWCRDHGTPANGTVRATTPSGGTHLVYYGKCRSTSSKIAPGVDTRGEGGYIVAAPSVVGGKSYRWDPDGKEAPADLPAAVTAACAARAAAKAGPAPVASPAAGSLAELVGKDVPLHRKGKELCGPCPWCGGVDRFVVGWDGEGRDGRERYFCRQCERKGDSVSWLIDRVGLHPVQAKDARGVPVPAEFRPITPRLGTAQDVLSDRSPRPATAHTGGVAEDDGADAGPPWAKYRIEASEYIATPPPPVEWDVEGLIERGSLFLCYGKPGSLKSMVMAELALCMSAGRAWMEPEPPLNAPSHDLRPIPCAGGPVAWIDLDNGRKRTHHRIHSLAAGQFIKPEQQALSVYSFPPLDLTKSEVFRELEAIIRHYSLRQLWIDTLINSMAVKSENDNSELRGPLLGLRVLTEVTGCSIGAIHHPRKGAATGRLADDLRGGGALVGAVDLALRVERDEDRIKISATKTRGDMVRDIYASWNVVRDTMGQMTMARFAAVPPFDVSDQTTTRSNDAEEDVLAVLRASTTPMWTAQIVKDVEHRREVVINTLAKLVRDKVINMSRGARGAKVYSV